MENFKSFDLQMKILKSFGLMPNQQHSDDVRGWIQHLFLIDIIMLLNSVTLWNADNIFELSVLLTEFVSMLLLCFKSFCIIMKRKEIAKVIEELNELLIECGELNMFDNAKFEARMRKYHKMNIFYWVFGLTSAASAVSIPLLNCQSQPYVVAFKIWFPFDYEESFFWFVCVAIYESFCVTAGCILIISIDFFPLFFMTAISGIIDELNEKLSSVKDTSELVNCIKFHIKVKDLVRAVEDAFSSIIFAQYYVSSVAICTTTFVLSMVSAF